MAHLQWGQMKELTAQCLMCITSLRDGMILPQVEQRSWPAGRDSPSVSSDDEDPGFEGGVVLGKWEESRSS